MRALLRFLPGAPWLVGITVAAFLAGTGAAYLKGRGDGAAIAAAECEARELARIAREIGEAERRDRAASREIAARNATARIRLERISELSRKVEEYEDELAARPDPGCALSDDDARRLSGIR